MGIVPGVEGGGNRSWGGGWWERAVQGAISGSQPVWESGSKHGEEGGVSEGITSSLETASTLHHLLTYLLTLLTYFTYFMCKLHIVSKVSKVS